MTRVQGLPFPRLEPRALLALALLLTALLYAAWGVAGEVRELDVDLALTVALLGLLTGWALAMTRLRGWAALILAAVLGIGGVFLHVGGLGGELLALFQTSAHLAGDVVRWLLSLRNVHDLLVGPLLDWGPTVLVWRELGGAIGILLARVGDWIRALVAHEPAFDLVAATLLWGLIVWAVSVWAGWVARRPRRPLAAIAPAAALLLAVRSYARDEARAGMVVILGATLLLLALMAHDTRLRRWKSARVGIDPVSQGSDTAKVVALLSLVLVVMAAMAPSLSVSKVVELIQNRDREKGVVDDLAESLGVERPPEAPGERTTFTEMRTAGLPRRHLIGSGTELSQRRVMFITTDDAPPPIDPQSWGDVGPGSLPTVPRHYWRSRTYDLYASFGWYTGDADVVEYGAGEPAITETLMMTTGRRIVQQEVRIASDLGGLLYVAGTLVTADHDYTVAWRSPEDAFAATIDATTYRAESVEPVYTVKQLQATGSDYPDWVRSRYLSLPDTLPERVLVLARELTAAEPTPYDRAHAIETYLRGFPYTLNVPAPPPDRDVVDYFLFDLQEGYCDYYASAMVVLARAAGLPARYVIGYATGTYDYALGRYVVTEANAHAWVEVYFPGYGWIEFEPTAGRPAIERPVGAEPEQPAPIGVQEVAEPATAVGWNLSNWPWWLIGVGGLLLLVLAGLLWPAADIWRLRRLEPAAAMAILYERVRRQGRRLAVPIRVSDTPHEFATSFAGWAVDVARENWWGDWLTPAVKDVRYLVGLHVQTNYSSHEVHPLDQRRAVLTWNRLHRQLWAARVRQWMAAQRWL